MSQEKAKDPKGKDEAKSDEIPDAELDKVSGGLVIDSTDEGLKRSAPSGFNTTGDTIIKR